VLTEVGICNVVWVWTPYSLVHSYECFGGECFGSVFTGHQEMEAVFPDQNLSSQQSVYSPKTSVANSQFTVPKPQ